MYDFSSRLLDFPNDVTLRDTRLQHAGWAPTGHRLVRRVIDIFNGHTSTSTNLFPKSADHICDVIVYYHITGVLFRPNVQIIGIHGSVYIICGSYRDQTQTSFWVGSESSASVACSRLPCSIGLCNNAKSDWRKSWLRICKIDWLPQSLVYIHTFVWHICVIKLAAGSKQN